MENVNDLWSCMMPCSQKSVGGARKLSNGSNHEIFNKKVWVEDREEQSRQQRPTTCRDQQSNQKSRNDKDDVEEQHITRRDADEQPSGRQK